MRRWYITRKASRVAEPDEREEMGFPRWPLKRSPDVFIEWTEYLDVKYGRGRWYESYLRATAFPSQEKAKAALARLCDKIESEAVTLMMIGKHDVADEIQLIEHASIVRIPKCLLKDRRKVPHRALKSRTHWPFNKEKRREKDRSKGSEEGIA